MSNTPTPNFASVVRGSYIWAPKEENSSRPKHKIVAAGRFIMGLWKSIFCGVLADMTGNPDLRGLEGEHMVIHVLSKLPTSEYSVYGDLLLPLSDGDSTQIDHVVFSQFGIFVIETKNYGGWIYASEKSKLWTQIQYQKKSTFQNPLHQNYKHIKALQHLTGLPPEVFHNMAVFTGNATFKKPPIKNVITHRRDLNQIISAYQEEVLSKSQVNEAIAVVEAKTRQFDSSTARREHVRNSRTKQKKKKQGGGVKINVFKIIKIIIFISIFIFAILHNFA